jgi:hypothetical protein
MPSYDIHDLWSLLAWTYSSWLSGTISTLVILGVVYLWIRLDCPFHLYLLLGLDNEGNSDSSGGGDFGGGGANDDF